MKLSRLIRQTGKRLARATPILRRHIFTSIDYRVLAGLQEARDITVSSRGWLAARTAARQERAYQSLIAAMKRGEPRLDFTIAADAVAATGIANPALLEVGCGSGYYADVFATLLAGGVRYTGVDYSSAMIARARARAPAGAFEVADATKLPYADRTFDIVFNGVSLMHILDYPNAIAEAARVAAGYCIFHTVPVFPDYRTTFLRKYAYGAPVVEVIFGKQELMQLCADAGLRLEREWPSISYDVFEATGHRSVTETYLFSV
jgi:SAM-dependent methyltransferase